jgi:hypothetical protein
MVVPDSPSSRSSLSTAAPDSLSSAPVGSSASNRDGCLTSARATATRWRSPPDSWCGRWRVRSASPTRAGRTVLAG